MVSNGIFFFFLSIVEQINIYFITNKAHTHTLKHCTYMKQLSALYRL